MSSSASTKGSDDSTETRSSKSSSSSSSYSSSSSASSSTGIDFVKSESQKRVRLVEEPTEPVLHEIPHAAPAAAASESASKAVEGTPEVQSRMEEGFFRRSRVSNSFQKNLTRKENTNVLSWKNLSYTVTAKLPATRKPGAHVSNFFACSGKTEKHVLKNVSGYVRPGQFLAIMGPSGSGKTTLLNLLAQRVKEGTITGEILLNGRPIPQKPFKTISAYVQQDDLLFSHLTVKETLEFTASLKVSKKVPREERDKRVTDVIEELGLKKVTGTIIGNEQVRGVSGGERKRTNVSNELMGNPELLFLDEPTSGLDAFTALSIIETLDSLARNNYSIVCTVHQPRYNIFELFDMLMLLSAGEVVYFGPAKQAVAYFSSLNYPCPKYYNPADYFMDLFTKDNRTPEAQEASARTIEHLTNAYKQSPMIKAAENPVLPDAPFSSDIDPPGYLQQFSVLFMRAIRNVYRDKGLTIARVFQTLITALVIGFTYLRMGHSQEDAQSRRGLLFLILMNQMFGALFMVFNVFPVERVIYWKEHNAGLYSTLPYYLAKSLAELPLTCFFPLLFSAVAYWLVNLHPAFTHFLIFIAFVELATLTAEGLGLSITIAVPKKEAASVVSLLVLVLFVIFGGFYLNSENTPKYFIWLKWLSFVRWSFEGLVVNEFKGVNFHCDWLSPSSTNVTCPFPTGDELISQLEFRSNWQGWDALVLIGMILFYRTLAYFALRFVRPKQEAY